MFLTRNIKSLENISQQSQDDGKIESKLVEISNSLLINYFIPTDSNFKPDLLPLLFQHVLPLTGDNLPISARVQAGSFLNRLCSLLTSFSPSCLLTVFDAPTLAGADGGGLSGYNSYGSSSNAPTTKKQFSIAAELVMAVLLLDPPAQAFFLIFLTKSLHFLSPKKRNHFIGTCHDLLFNSKPEVLSNLSNDDWEILVNSFSVETLSTIVNFLINNGQINENSKSEKSIGKKDKNSKQAQKNINKNITKAIVFFLERDPKSILPLLLKTSSLNFLCQFIPLIPTYMHLPVHLIKDRIIFAIKNFKENSNDASFALEITKLIMKRERLLDEKNDWIEILKEVINFWMDSSTIISHRSSILELFSIAVEMHMIPVDFLKRFFVVYELNSKDESDFDYDYYLVKCSDESNPINDPIKSIPTTILVSLIQLTSVYIKITKKVPKGFSEFCLKELFDRDPLIYVAILKLLTDCFNIMYKIIPRNSTRILDLCLNPLPKYFVEQIAIIHLIESIDFKETFPLEKFKYKPTEIIYHFLKQTPHPSLLPEIKEMVKKLDLQLPISQFDWFEESSSLVYLLRSASPFIIIELLDYSVIPPASFPTAISYLSDCILSYSNRKYNDKSSNEILFDFQNEIQVIELSLLLFSRSLYIITEAIKVLKLDIRYISSLVKHHASNEWEGIVSNLNSLYEVINEDLTSTVFGRIISSCFIALSSTIKYLNFLSIRKAIDIVKFSSIFASAFTPQTCKLISEISQRVENSFNTKEVINSNINSINSNSNQTFYYQNFHQEIIKFFSSNFQFKHSVIVSLTAIECISESELKVVSDYIRVASNSNRIVLLMNKTATESHFLNPINENENEKDDLNSFKSVQYNTFLAFKNDPDMADYVAKCANEIPFQSWIIEETDLTYFSKLHDIEVNNLDLLDSIHQKAIKLHPNSFIINTNKEEFDDSLILNEISDQITFQINPSISELISKSNKTNEFNEEDFKEVEIPQFSNIKPFSPYRGFEPNSSLFFGFLWNSKRKLSDENFMRAQDYAMLLNESRINVSFLSYASRFEYKSKENSKSSISYVDVEKWMKLIKVDRFDKNSILSVCILLTFIKKSWSNLSDNELKFIYHSFNELGFHDFNLFNFVRIFKEESGLNRMFAESIISIDPSRFDEFPFFSDIFKGKDNFEKKFDEIIDAIPSNIKRRQKRRILLHPQNLTQSEILQKQENLPVVNTQKVNESDANNIELIHAKSGALVSSDKAVFNNFVYSKSKMDEFIEKEDELNEKSNTEASPLTPPKQQQHQDEKEKERINDESSPPKQTGDNKEEEESPVVNGDDSKDNKVDSINSADNEPASANQEEPASKDEQVSNKEEPQQQQTTKDSNDDDDDGDGEPSSNNNNDEPTSGNDKDSVSQEESASKDESNDYDEDYSSTQCEQQTFEYVYEVATLFSRYLSPQSTLSKHEQYFYPRGVRMIDDHYFPLSIELERFKIFRYKGERGAEEEKAAAADAGDGLVGDGFEEEPEKEAKKLNKKRIVIEKLISVFESSSFCDSFILFVLLHLGLTDNEYQKCLGPLQRFTKSHPMNVHLVMADLSYLSTLEKTKLVNITPKALEITISEDKYIPLSRYPSLLLTPATSYSNCISNSSFFIDGNKPPSYTREFVSLLTSPYLPINITMSDLMAVSKSSNMKPVLFPLLYKGFEKFSLNLFDFTSPLFSIPDEDYLLLTNGQSIQFRTDNSTAMFLSSSLAENSTSSSSSSFLANNNTAADFEGNLTFSIILTNDTLNKLKSYFSKVTKTTSIIAKEFFRMNPDSLCKCFNTVSADAAFIEISEKLIDAVINNPSYLNVAVEIMKAIISRTEIMQLCMIANSESFLNAKQFICVFLMLKLFERKLERSKDEVFKEMWNAMKESVPEKVKDKKRLEILTMKDSIQAFANVFNSSF